MPDKTKKPSKATSARERAAKLRARGSGHASGFVGFVREQGVVGLAVGLAVGAAAGSAVKSIVDNFINPIVGFILGGMDLAKLSWRTGLTRGGHELVFGWGAIVSAIITLLATAFVIYWLVHIIHLDRLDKAKE
ncbi:MAG TPA: MscL family protein [Candidatus Saccharimonadaceae bacterium]|nr:MscL family protein [Candidatus Saccharimonadaceae bacterium]